MEYSRQLKKIPSSVTIEKPMKSGKSILISDDCIDHLNYRIEQEEYSARIYLSMSLFLSNNGYLNAGKLWLKYSHEELKHAEWAREFLLSFGVQPLTPRIEEPQQTFTGLPQIIKLSYQHEIDVTTQIKDMADGALKEGNHMLYELCLQYMKEQVEEHDKTQNLMDQLNAFGDDKIAMRLFDQSLAD